MQNVTNMSEQSSHPSETSGLQGEIHPVQSVLRFLRAVRYRRGIMIVALVASGLLGGLYCATTPREYESRASLLVMQTGMDPMTSEMSGRRIAQDHIPTYRKMLSSEVVLDDAIQRLKPEQRIDLEGVPRSDWSKRVRENLSVTSVRDANILGIAYRSKSPETAKAVVDSILEAYLEFMKQLHKTSTREVLEALTKKRDELDRQLRQKEEERCRVRAQSGELVIAASEQGPSVVEERALSLNQAWIAARSELIDAQAQLTAMEAAIHNGEDLQHHALAMVEGMGGDFLLQRLGLKTVDPYATSRVNERLLENRASLPSLLRIYGPRHRKVLELQERIVQAEEYLRNRYEIENARLREVSSQELAPLLLGMARQQLRRAAAHEVSTRSSYEEHMQAAINIDRIVAWLDGIPQALTRTSRFAALAL